MDGTAKGGVLCAISHVLSSSHILPQIMAIGIGEGVDQLIPFDAGAFAKELVGD
jgi:fused signal recognition particle receptor